MNTNIRNIHQRTIRALVYLSAPLLLGGAGGGLFSSCADYNVTDNFTASADPTFVEPYKDLAPVKSYLDRDKYVNMSLGTALNMTDFNRQELAHAAAITNFDDVTFGSSMMSGSIVNNKGLMNFTDTKDLLDHVEEINGVVYGSPIVANANQAYDWLNYLTAPIEIPVEFEEGKSVDFSTVSSIDQAGASIVQYAGERVLKINKQGKVRIIDGFEVDPLAKYTTEFYIRADKNATFNVYFSGNKVDGNASADGKWSVQGGKWTKIVVESKSAEGETEGYLRIENTRTTELYVAWVKIGFYPDSHRQQTAEEIKDTIDYALKTWCDALMKNNAGRIKTFDLIDEAIDNKSVLDNGMYDIKHSSERIFWQDILGSENYAPEVSKVASSAYERYGGDPAKLRFFISETGLEEQQKLESLNYWIKIWEANGAKIDGINAKLSLSYSEDPIQQAANIKEFEDLLNNLIATGKLIRLSNFDIKYQNAEGKNVTAKEITGEQRQKLADYYAYIIKSYMNKVPSGQQAGICKGSMADTGDPVGLWSVDSKSKDWVRTVTYKAFCDALSGE